MTSEEKGPTPPEAHRSILEFLAGMPGGKARVALRQDDSAPVLKPVEGLTRSGKYQLQGEIARGGVGVVLKGHDTDLGRDVAMKMVREEHRDNPDVLQRFVEEAQIGGQLQHPGIVPVYDLGLQEGRPFFTMKLIKGRTLASLIEERKEGRRRLLAIFEAVCQTMAYAHTRGVIHRDLKPANVMVGAFGEVHVVDWGMGKVLKSGGIEDERRARDARQTVVATVRSSGEQGSVGSQSMVGSVMGTPAYMPPEQAMGEIEQMDERSDVFSLGGILAEILTGQPPYAGGGSDLIQRAARGDLEPCRGRLAACDADGELKAIANQCLVAARQARPRHAGEVQQQIGRHLAGIEERARAAQVEAAEDRVRVAEAKRKQKLTLALAASVLATVVLGGGGFWYVQSENAAREARLREQFQSAVLDAGRAEDASDALAKAARARDLLAQAETAMPEAVVADLGRLEGAAGDALARERRGRENRSLLQALEALRGPSSEDERFVIDWPELDRRYGAAFAEYGLRPDEGPVAEAAAALAARGENERLAAGLDDWAFVRREAAAREGATRLLAVASALDGDPVRATLREAILSADIAVLSKLAAEADAKTTDARTLHLMAESLRRLAKPADAYAFALRAFEGHPADFFLAHSLARSSYGAWQGGEDVTAADGLRYYLVARSLRPDNYIASVELAQQYINAREYAQAERFLRDLIAGRPGDAVLHAELGLVLEARGREGEALAEYRRAIELDGDQAWCRRLLGAFLSSRGQVEEGLEHAREAVALVPGSAPAHVALGNALLNLGQPGEALAAFQRAADLAPPAPFHRARIAMALRLAGRGDDALGICRKLPKEFPELANIHIAVALELLALGRPGEALDLVRAALARAEQARRPAPAQTASLHLAIADVLDAMGNAAEADESVRRALATDPTDAGMHLRAAYRFHARGRVEEVLPLLQRVLVLEPLYFDAHRGMGSSLSQLGRPKEAIPHWRRAIEIDPRNAIVHGALAEALLAAGEAAEALTWAQKANELAPSLAPVSAALATALAANGKHAEALAELDTVDRPLPANLIFLSASVKARMGRREEAIAELVDATRLAPSFSAAHGMLAGLLLEANRIEEALMSARRAVEVAPQSGEGHFTLGRVLLHLRRWEEAEASFQRGLAFAKSPAAMLEAAQIPSYRGEHEETLRRLRAIVAGDPDDADACMILAWALATSPLERRNAEEALSLARRELKLRPDNPTYRLAAALFRAGQHGTAEQEFERIFDTADNGHACIAYLRAMNLLALDRADEARRWYDQAQRRIATEGEHPFPDHAWLRDEAVRLFGER